MSYERFIAYRYLRSRRQHRSLSVITWIAIIGVALGVAALIVTLSIMNGFERDLKNALIGANAHLTIDKIIGNIEEEEIISTISPQLSQFNQIKSWSPYLFRQALLVGKEKSSGSLVRGIDVLKELTNTSIISSLTSSPYPNQVEDQVEDQELILKSLNEITNYRKKNPDGTLGPNQQLQNIILGSTLARNLGVYVGDTIQLIPPEIRISPFGSLPRSKVFSVSGLFQSGLSGYDETIAIMDINTAKIIFKQNDYNGIALYLNDINKVVSTQNELSNILDFPFYIRSWIDENQNLFSVIQLEKYALAIILTSIILIAAFNILSSLVMLVQEKKRDIAVLKSLGSQNKSIMYIFLIQGLIIGISGTIIGLILGISICLLIDNYQIISIPSGVYLNNEIPMAINWLQVVFILFTSFIICLLVTLLPSRIAANTNTIEGLRYE